LFGLINLFFVSDEFFANYYNYYKRRYAPKVDPRLVIGVTITIVSIIQVRCSLK